MDKSSLEAPGNFTGYTYDVTLELYFAQSRFYDAANHRFISEDTAQDGSNWYIYCRDNPVMYADIDGAYSRLQKGSKSSDVELLQKALVYLGYSVGSAGVDGSFGNDTEAAVNRFKDFYIPGGNTGDYRGVVGDTTWNLLIRIVVQRNNISSLFRPYGYRSYFPPFICLTAEIDERLVSEDIRPLMENLSEDATWADLKTLWFEQILGAGKTPADAVQAALAQLKKVSSGTTIAQATDADILQAGFMNADNGGNVDGSYGLQCVDFVKWYLDTYTTLYKISDGALGNGCAVVGNLNAKHPELVVHDLAVDVPVPPAVYSTRAGLNGWGGSGVPEGHTGIIVSVDQAKKEIVTVWSGPRYYGGNPNSRKREYYYPSDQMGDVKFIELKDYLK